MIKYVIAVLIGAAGVTLWCNSKRKKCPFGFRACVFHKNGYCSHERAQKENTGNEDDCKYFQDAYD